MFRQDQQRATRTPEWIAARGRGPPLGEVHLVFYFGKKNIRMRNVAQVLFLR
jgi:hypothetical protein